MENHTNKRVILITGDNKWYEQAIFIVKKNTPKSSIPKNFIREAEEIIESYMVYGKKGNPNASKVEYANYNGQNKIYIDNNEKMSKKKSNRKFDFALNLLMLFSCCFLAGTLAFMFYK